MHEGLMNKLNVKAILVKLSNKDDIIDADVTAGHPIGLMTFLTH